MAGKKFVLGDELRASDVSRVDRGLEQIEYIPIDKIDPDPENFYSLAGLEELAANIEMIGLQQPLRVRDGDGGRVIIVSGHRRKAACMLLRDGGDERFERLPCIRERADASPDLRELRLIFANSSTRVLTAAELSKQAERVSEILAGLKEKGYEFEGRMRDQVAAVLSASSSRVARLHAIRGRLDAGLLEEFDAGRLGETAAYRLSQEAPTVQRELSRKLGPALRGITTETLEACIAQERRGAEDDSRCHSERSEESVERSFADAQDDNGSGGDGGPDAGKVIDGLKKYLDGKSEEDKVFWTCIEEAADGIIKRTFRAPLTGPAARKNGIDALRLDLRMYCCGDGHVDWDGSNKGLRVRLDLGQRVERTWTEVYDALAAIALARYRETLIDRQNGRRKGVSTVDHRGLPQSASPTAPSEREPRWQTGTPGREGRYLCQLDLGLNRATEQTCNYEDGEWTAYGRPVSDVGKVVGWWPLPGRE